MIFIDNGGITDAQMNLAIEEFALTRLDPSDTYLLFYVNSPSIIIGRNQNTFEEIHVDYVREHNITVVRRLSGGGAVYHDLGNLNFSFITQNDGNSFHNFRKFTEPVVRALQQLGVPAELSGRNDIVADGRKISGNAQFATRGRMFSHGTLLLNSNLDDVTHALNVKQEKIESKGIKSIRSRVANIQEFLEVPLGMDEFKRTLLRQLFQDQSTIPQYHLTSSDWDAIHEISRSRYQNWEWNFGQSPPFNIQRSHRFPVGSIDIRLDVQKGVIQHCKIYGDFFGQGEVSEVERSLLGVRYDSADLRTALSDIDIAYFFGQVTLDEFLSLLY